MTPEEIMRFFDKEIEPAAFARYIRKYNHDVVINRLHQVASNTELSGDLDVVLDGVFWTNQFADIIDPPPA